MKVAICFYGQPRFYDEMYHHIWKIIIDIYSADVFIHTYWNKDYINEVYPVRVSVDFDYEDIRIKENTIEDLINLYKPKNIEYDWYDSSKIIKHQSNYYQYYTQYAVKNLKKYYEKEHNFKYDMIIRTRFDYVFGKIDHDPDLSYLWVPGTCPNDPNWGREYLYTDAFSISNSDIFDKISDCYLNLAEFEANNKCCEEYAFKSQIIKENIPIKEIEMKADVLRSDRVALKTK